MKIYEIFVKIENEWRSMGLIMHKENIEGIIKTLKQYVKDYEFKYTVRALHQTSDSFYGFHKGLNLFDDLKEKELFAKFFFRMQLFE